MKFMKWKKKRKVKFNFLNMLILFSKYSFVIRYNQFISQSDLGEKRKGF